MTLQDVFNTFCPTGEGGGVDASCGGEGGSGGGGSSHKVGTSVRLKGRGGKPFTIQKITRTGKLVLTGLSHEGIEVVDPKDIV